MAANSNGMVGTERNDVVSYVVGIKLLLKICY